MITCEVETLSELSEELRFYGDLLITNGRESELRADTVNRLGDKLYALADAALSFAAPGTATEILNS